MVSAAAGGLNADLDMKDEPVAPSEAFNLAGIADEDYKEAGESSAPTEDSQLEEPDPDK